MVIIKLWRRGNKVDIEGSYPGNTEGPEAFANLPAEIKEWAMNRLNTLVDARVKSSTKKYVWEVKVEVRHDNELSNLYYSSLKRELERAEIDPTPIMVGDVDDNKTTVDFYFLMDTQPVVHTMTVLADDAMEAGSFAMSYINEGRHGTKRVIAVNLKR